MAVLMAEDNSRYNEMNTILYEMDASKPVVIIKIVRLYTVL